MVTANRASRFSPISQRSDTKRKVWKLRFAPESTQARFSPSMPYFFTYFFKPASEVAPEGSATARTFSKISFNAAQISSLSTKTTSSTYCLQIRKVSSPIRLTAIPSANKPTWSKSTGWPAFNAWYKQAESLDSTPMTWISGKSCFTNTAIPAIKPPPPTGTKMRFRSERCWMSSIAIVPCPAITAGASNGWIKVIFNSFESSSALALASSKFAP